MKTISALYKPGIGIAIASIKRFQITTCTRTVHVLLIACLFNEFIDYIESTVHKILLSKICSHNMYMYADFKREREREDGQMNESKSMFT